MEKIKKYKDATAAAIKMAESKKEIQLWDERKTARVAMVELFDGDLCKIQYVDTVTGEVWNDRVSIHELSAAIWENRKFINNSGQIENL